MDDQGFKSWTNFLGGQSFYLPPGLDLRSAAASVLEGFRDLLTDHHFAVYSKRRSYLSWLARRARIPGMREWLLAMADAGQCGMFFHSAEVMQQSMQRDVIIRCFLRSGLRPCGFRLSTNKIAMRHSS